MPGCNSVWSDGTCWANTITNPPSLTPPVDGEFVGISPTTTVTLDQDAHPSTLDVFGTMNQAGHSLTADNVVVAPASFSAAVYNLSGGTLTINGGNTFNLDVGGTFNQSGGTLTATKGISLDTIPFSGRTGTYNLTDGNLSAVGLVIGNGSSPLGINAGIFNQSGGAASFTGPVILGGPLDPAPIAGGIGTLTISDGTFDVASSVGFGMVVGGTGTGTVTQSGGTVTIKSGPTMGGLEIGRSAGGSGSYTMSGGELNVDREALGSSAYMLVGNAGTGAFTQTGGAVSVEGTLTLGFSTGGSGTYDLSGGGSTLDAEHIVIRNGTFTQSVGAMHTIGGNLSISALAGSTGSYTLSDGTLQVAGDERVGLVAGAAPGSASFTHSGGVNQIAGTLIVGAGGGGLYTQSGGSLVAKDEIIGGLGTGKGVFTQTAGVNTVSHVLTIGSGGGTSGTYNLAGGIINAGNPKIQGLVNNDTLNITGVSQISGNILNNATGTIKATGAILNVLGTVTNFGTINIDPSSVTVQNLNVGASGVLIAGAGNVLSVTGNFINNSLQNTLWNTAAAELDFTGGGTHIFALAGQSGNGFANNFSWGTIDLGATDVLDLTLGSGNALYFKMLDGLDITGNVINNIIGANGLFLYYDAATDPFLHGNYLLQGGGMLIAVASGSNPNPVPEPESIALLFMGLSVSTAVGLRARRRRARRPQSDGE